MSEFAEFDEHFGPDEDLLPNRWRNAQRTEAYYPAPTAGSGGRVAVTVITAVRVNGLNLEYKSRTIYVPKADAESAWTIWHTGTECPEP